MPTPQSLSPAARDELRSVLDGAGLPGDPAHFLELVKDAVRRVVFARHVADPSALTNHEITELREIGLDPLVSATDFDDASEATTAKMTAILADSMTVEDGAVLINLHPSRLRQMLSDRSMYGIKEAGGWRLPAFQFAGHRQVRNLGPVLRAAPERLHPIELFNWLTRPEPALLIEGRATSPIEWLELGGAVEPVAAIAAEL